MICTSPAAASRASWAWRSIIVCLSPVHATWVIAARTTVMVSLLVDPAQAAVRSRGMMCSP